ncbi:STAS/SEC14 domain-containing protein [Pseudoalteromonas sp. SSDWG2]|uniref:STAS/SEC14 domain-containing protein n=1 Tax=Pseudoalteromonas sp. SSDWG2 TaxID=3139391 RepID=UPI003BAB753A
MSLSHGTTHVELHDGIIEVAFIGSFNIYGVQAFVQKVKDIVSQLGEQEFAMLIDNTKVEGGTPEAYDELNRYNEWLCTQAMVAKAFVMESSMAISILLQRTPSLAKQNVEFFTNVEDARQWLKQRLAN